MLKKIFSSSLDIFQVNFALTGIIWSCVRVLLKYSGTENFAIRKMLTINFRETTSHAQYSLRCVSVKVAEWRSLSKKMTRECCGRIIRIQEKTSVCRRGRERRAKKKHDFVRGNRRTADILQLQLLNMQFILTRSRLEVRKLNFVTSPSSRKSQARRDSPRKFFANFLFFMR